VNQTLSPGMTENRAAPAFDPLDMRNYAFTNDKDIKAGAWMDRAKAVGVPLAVLVFLFFHLQWCGRIDLFETQTKVKTVALLYSTMGIFLSSLILWLTEAVPMYLTSFLVVVAVILTGILPMREAFAYMGEPVMILNIGSFICMSTTRAEPGVYLRAN